MQIITSEVLFCILKKEVSPPQPPPLALELGDK